jgi:putative membrane protein
MLSLILILVLYIASEVITKIFFHDSWHDKSIGVICVLIISVALSRFLSRFDFVKRLFISKYEKDRQVQEQAEKIFFLQRLGEIKSKNALLLYISVMEHRIVILPDPNIKMADIGKLTAHSVSLLKTAFKNKEYEEGLISMIHYLQTSLEKDFPRLEKAENLVSNKLIWWKD